ncbi:DUF1254 domain-containing protein [Vibrio sp. WXL103]|uniref:DUF1254 domain-containing protein n=1 Tax=Vibrio sp. WXL103 TaxID=3450710 RepID=UPI003EC619FC
MNMKLKAIGVAVAATLLAPSVYAQADKVFADSQLTTPSTQENVAQGLEADGYTLGVMAHNWGYPLVRMERLMRDYINVPDPKPATSYRGHLNQLGWATELSSPATAGDMPTANNDTLYMSSVVHLTEPYILSVPDTDDRYYVINVFNMYHELEHYVGRRATGTQEGRFALVPPGWEGELPEDVTRLDVLTDKVWLWGRLHMTEGEDLAELHKLQDGFGLETLSGKVNSATELDAMPEIDNDPLGFFEHLAFALQYNDIRITDEALFAQFERIGLTKDGFDRSVMTEQTMKGLMASLEVAPKVAISNFASTAERIQGWDWVRGLDDYGYNYPLRTVISGPYAGGQGEQEAMYPVRFIDSEGEQLSGEHRYVIRFEEEPPVDAFWSLTAYGTQDRALVATQDGRHKIDPDMAAFTKRADGSFEIPLQFEQPTGEFAGNWMPAPEGDFYIIFRLYQPQERIMSGDYVLPQVVKVDKG